MFGNNIVNDILHFWHKSKEEGKDKDTIKY